MNRRDGEISMGQVHGLKCLDDKCYKRNRRNNYKWIKERSERGIENYYLEKISFKQTHTTG